LGLFLKRTLPHLSVNLLQKHQSSKKVALFQLDDENFKIASEKESTLFRYFLGSFDCTPNTQTQHKNCYWKHQLVANRAWRGMGESNGFHCANQLAQKHLKNQEQVHQGH